MKIVTTYNLNFGYKKTQALTDLNVEIPKGIITGLVGHNGSGKSTLLKIILKELVPFSGILTDYSTRHGFLIEDGSYYPHLSALENLKYYYYTKGITLNEIHEMLEIFGLDQVKHKRLSEYSMGMKKRLSIAMAFVCKPDLILLDEPTNELDPDGVILLKNILRKYSKERDTSVIYSSHILSDITELCEYLIVLKTGKAVFQGFKSTLENEIGKLENNSLEFIYDKLQITK